MRRGDMSCGSFKSGVVSRHGSPSSAVAFTASCSVVARPAEVVSQGHDIRIRIWDGYLDTSLASHLGKWHHSTRAYPDSQLQCASELRSVTHRTGRHDA